MSLMIQTQTPQLHTSLNLDIIFFKQPYIVILHGLTLILRNIYKSINTQFYTLSIG